MFNSVEFVRSLCRERKIPIAKIEKDLGYGNGYFNAKKQSKIPYDRAVEIAEYLSVPPELILTGEEKAPTAGERDILDDVDVAFYGDFKELNEDEKETVRDMVRLMRQRKERRSQ